MPSRWRCPAPFAVLVVLAAAAQLPAQEAATDAAPGKMLEIQGRVLDIVGVSLGIDATLKELGAKVTAQEIRIELAADVLFDFDKAELRPDALDALRKVATVIASTPGPVVIEGHTDSKGEDAYNQTLSRARAPETVRMAYPAAPHRTPGGAARAAAGAAERHPAQDE
jgi:outer membrane protein OmpA-like peptidoglycan-associated protein